MVLMVLLKIVKSFLERDIQAVYVLSLFLPSSNSKSASYTDLLLHFLNPKQFRIFPPFRGILIIFGSTRVEKKKKSKKTPFAVE